MPYIRPGVRRLFDLMLRRREVAAHNVEAEVALHLELRVEQLVRRGVAHDDALREAVRRFGRVEPTVSLLEHTAQRRDRKMGLQEWWHSVAQDFRYAMRGLRREPAFTGFAVATLALGIGANAAVYGVVDRLLLRGPEHMRDPERMVRIVTTVARPGLSDVTFGSAGYVLYDNLRRSAHAFDGVAAYQMDDFTLGRGRGARTVRGGAATAGFFPLLGVRPARGRFFAPDEDEPARPSYVVVLGDALWRGQFGADPAMVGREIELGGSWYTVVGIAPRGFTGVDLGRVDVWVPISTFSQTVTENWPRAWNAQWLNVVGRLKPGISLDAATDDATRTHRATYDGPPEPLAQARIGAVPIRFTGRGQESNELAVSRWLLGVTVVVLLIACSNVANLLLARAIRRRGEVGVRLALGAGRSRLVRLFLTESLLLALLGGLASLLVAGAISVMIRQSLLTNIDWTSPPVSGRVLAVSLAVATAAGLLIGLAPALHAARGSLRGALQRGTSVGRRLKLDTWPMVLQAGLTATLLIGAGLFTQSLRRAEATPLGIETDRVVVADVHWTSADEERPGATGADRARRAAMWRRAVERVRELPGVTRAALAVGSPFGSSFGLPVFVTGWDSIPRLPGGGPYVAAVSADYFATVGTQLRRGRTFQPEEGDGTEPLAIVNETMAQTLWPGRDAIGQCIRMGADTAPCARIVGIAENARRYELREDPSMQYYIPIGQERGFGGTVLVARAGEDAIAAVIPTIVRVIEQADASVARAVAQPMRNSIDPLLRPWRLGATIFGLGGVLALLVAALGLYSVMSYAVAQRTHEVGVRLALGATPRAIVGLIMRGSLAMALVGMAGGVLVALYAGRFVEGLLFDTSPRDPTVLATTAVVLVSAAILATLRPALRARGVDPMRALKAD